MRFNLNEFLIAVSFALDFVEMDILGVTSNHGKRTAYISMRIAKELGLGSEKLHDLVALSILHDNGASEKALHDQFLEGDSIDVRSLERIKEHCTIGEENIKQYPFLTDVSDVIRYHHEKYDGNGFFQLSGSEIPLMAQIIHLADIIEVNFELENNDEKMQKAVLKFIEGEREKSFSPEIINAFFNVADHKEFWNNLKDDQVGKALREGTPEYVMELPIEEVRKITGVFSRIIDAKSKYTQRHSRGLAEKVLIMANHYDLDFEEKMKLVIAANLHDIGKLAVANSILDSPNKLSDDEFMIIKKHPYLTRIALEQIQGFEEITEWAANHHEKLNGKGYPFGKNAENLDFNSRLMACLDIYEALTEERPYRRSLSHAEAMEILDKMKADGLIDSRITEDIDYVFGSLNALEENREKFLKKL